MTPVVSRPERQQVQPGHPDQPDRLVQAAWYHDWQDERHAAAFDHYHHLDSRNLIRNFEGFNDVRLLNERLDRWRAVRLLEVGCATGELYRYLKVKFPRVHYTGIDISRAAIARAQAKYPEGAFFVGDPSVPLAESLRALGVETQPDVVYAKDVVHHQTQPLMFLSQLISAASDMVIIRTRTRDVGTTELDPEQSCQYHYDGWMPYLVMNLQALIDSIVHSAPGCEVVVYRHHMILGGHYRRFLPKELYVKETGTAETAVGIFKQTSKPGWVTVKDRVDQNPNYTWAYRLRHALRQCRDAWYGRNP